MAASGNGSTRTGGREPRVRLDPAQRSAQILAAAGERFRRHGYDKVAMEEVAADAGVSRSLLHHYFGSKRELFLAVVRREVRIPASVPIVPTGTSGDLEAVLDVCIEWWLELVEVAGGLWPGGSGPGGFVDTDVDELLTAARDDLVERMLDEMPFPDVDRTLLRSTLRSFAAFAAVATDEWIRADALSREQVKVLLCSSLSDLIQLSVPAMEHGTDR